MALTSAKPEGLRQTRPHEYAIRFFFGGSCTALAGWVASRYGPAVGGLFMAFPAIFPAGATLIASHEKKRKAKAGMDGATRGCEAAALDAAGACLGAVALAAFAVMVWLALPGHNAVLIIAAATATWSILSGLLWLIWKRHPLRRLRRARTG